MTARSTANGSGFTLKELVLRLDAKIDTFITAHEVRHTAERELADRARSDPASTAAGRELGQRILAVSEDIASISVTVTSHERSLQRITGALILVSFLGFGTLALVLLRIAGFVP